jgi:site-specific DNA recombinase
MSPKVIEPSLRLNTKSCCGALCGQSTHASRSVGLRRGSGDLREQLAGIDSVLAEVARVSPVVALMADDEQTLIERWTAVSPDTKGKIVAEMMDVVVMPGRRGVRDFDPSLIEINWH